MPDLSHRFDENRSIWLADKEPYVEAPPLDRDVRADVAIVGGGFTGISTAYHLSKRFPDKRVVLLEARTIANGASGRNGGQMLNWVHGFDVKSPLEARRIYDATRETIDGILAIIAEHRLDVPHRRDGHLEVLTSARAAELAHKTLESLGEAGLPLRFLDRAGIDERIELQGVAGAVFDPLSGQIDGVALLRGLRPVLEERGVGIFESTPVLRIREGGTISIETPRAKVESDAVVLATNAYSPHLGYFRHAIVPLHSLAIGTEPLDPDEWARRGWKSGVNFTDDRGRLSYGTLTATGRVIFGGGSNSAYHYGFGNRTSFDPPPGRGVEDMRRQLLSYLPRLEGVRVTHRWSGPVALTLSRLCTMGVRGRHRNVLYAVGYSGHGVTMANLAGRVLTDLFCGTDEKWRGLPFLERRPRFIPPEPFRFLGYHAYTRLTGRSPRAYESEHN
jgi:glycine/D-amino acid oxidase-like deaminating enzyme